jgi:hemoglobin
MTTSNQRHVVQHPNGGWGVRKPHAARVSSRHRTQVLAQTRAKELLSHSGGGEAVTHGRDGQIRNSDTVKPAMADWSLLSPQGRVLFYIALCPGSTMKAIARAVDRTERQAWSIMQGLRRAGMLHFRKKDKRHHYSINLDAPLLHPTIAGMTLRPVMEQAVAQARRNATDICEEIEGGRTMPEQSLYERLGGVNPIAMVVDRFSDEIVKNPKLNVNSNLKDWNTKGQLAGLKFMRTVWICAATGGPFQYTGLNMHDAHKDLHITPEEFDEVGDEIGRALDHFGVPEREKQELLAAVAAHKGEVAS